MWTRLRLPLLMASSSAATVVVAGVRDPGVVTVVFLAMGSVAAAVRQLVVTVPRLRVRAVWRLLRSQRAYWGGQLAHLGVVVVALAIACSSAFAVRTTVTLERGASAEFAGYTVTFEKTERHELSDRTSTDAHVVFTEDGRVVRVAEPQLNAFAGRPQAVGQPSVWPGPTSDLYVALGALEDDRVVLNLFRYPLMSWLWVGGALIAAGGFWAVSGRPRRKKDEADGQDETSEPEEVARA
jgi:cytochrome c-type biogenesis protein CcmF